MAEEKKKTSEEKKKTSGYEVINECIVEGTRRFPGEFVNPGAETVKRLTKSNCLRFMGKE